MPLTILADNVDPAVGGGSALKLSAVIVSLRWASAFLLNKFVSFLKLGLAFVSTVEPNSRRDTTQLS